MHTQAPFSVIAVPLDHLTDGQVVHVEGHTFVAGETVLLVQCAHEVLSRGAEACDVSTVVPTTVDPHGAIAESFTVRRRITIGADRQVIDCGERVARCNISGSAATDTKRAGGTGIAFGDEANDTHPPTSPPGTSSPGTSPPATAP